MRWRLVALSAVIALLAVACGADEPTVDEPAEPDPDTEEPDEPAPDDEPDEGLAITLRYNSYLGEGVTAVQESLAWQDRVVELVEERTNHTIEFENFLDGTLGDGTESVAILQDGRADVGLVAPGFHPGDLPVTQISTIPFVTESVMGAMRANADLSVEHPDYSEEWQNANLKPVMWVAAGNATAALREPIESIDDLDGLRLRAIGRHGEALAAIGVDPVAMDTSELYEAIDRGVLDGFATLPFVTGLTGLGLLEVGPHVVDLGMGQYTAAVGAAFNLQAWEDLPTEVQDIMQEAAEWVYDEFIPSNLEPQDQATCENIDAEGGSILRLPQNEIDEWRDSVFDAISESWVNDVSAAGVDADAAHQFLEQYQERTAEHAERAEYEDGLQTCVAAQG